MGPTGSSSGNSTIVRRQLVRGAAALLGATGLLGPAAAQAAGPTSSGGTITLTITAWAYAGEPLNVGAELLYAVTAPFRAQHRGVKVQILPALAGNTGTVIPMILSGSPPDVIQDWDAGLWEYLNSGLVLPLDTYIKRDNLDLGIFDAGQLQAYYDIHHQLIALPAQTDPTSTAVNLSALDELGIPYPPEDWTYADAEGLWRQLARKLNGQQRLGGTIYRSSMAMPDAFYLIGFGGGYVDPSDPTRTIVDQPASIAALEWCARQLMDDVAGWRGTGGFRRAMLITRTTGSWDLPWQAAQWRGFKWRYYLMPRWPAQPATFCTTNFWAIPANVKHPDLSWELLKWVATSTHWQRGMMKVFLTVPSVQTLWPEWEEVVYGVAPPLRDKNIAAIAAGVRSGRAYPTGPFAYATQQAYGTLSTWWNKALARQMSVRQAMAQGAQQVNALLKQQRALAVHSASLRTGYGRLQRVPLGSAYPPPARTGAGVPPSPGKALVSIHDGSYALLGAGWDVWGESDNCAFACLPVTGSEGVYTCRVAAVQNVSCPYLSPWAKFGLMARGDLSDDAAEVTLEGTGANGTGMQMRFAANLPPAASGFGATSAGAVLGASAITQPNTKPAANYVKRPFWLRLRRQGLTWSCYTSWDGKTWQLLGSYTVDMGGCWVGLFADSGNFAFNGKGAIRVIFDHLDFTPTTFVQVGVPSS